MSIDSFSIQKHFCAISEGRDIYLQSLKNKTDNVTFGISLWKTITEQLPRQEKSQKPANLG